MLSFPLWLGQTAQLFDRSADIAHPVRFLEGLHECLYGPRLTAQDAGQAALVRVVFVEPVTELAQVRLIRFDGAHCEARCPCRDAETLEYGTISRAQSV